MEQKLAEIFKKAKYEAGTNIAPSVWQAIILRDKRIIRIKLWAFSLSGMASLVGLVPAWKVLSGDLAQSGFYEYFSLMFSSGNSILSYWQELAFSMAESLPIMSIVLSLSLVFILFLSLKYAAKQINNNYIGKAYGIA